jgi:hypothetical protein
VIDALDDAIEIIESGVLLTESSLSGMDREERSDMFVVAALIEADETGSEGNRTIARGFIDAAFLFI